MKKVTQFAQFVFYFQGKIKREIFALFHDEIVKATKRINCAL